MKTEFLLYYKTFEENSTNKYFLDKHNIPKPGVIIVQWKGHVSCNSLPDFDPRHSTYT